MKYRLKLAPAIFTIFLLLCNVNIFGQFTYHQSIRDDTEKDRYCHRDYHVASAGDVNNDGYDDIITSDYGSSKVFLYFGGPLDSLKDEPDLIFAPTAYPLEPPYNTLSHISNSDNRDFGRTISTAGDVNNDGYDDILIGAMTLNKKFPGYACIYFGAEGTSMDNLEDIFLSQNKFRFGYDVASAGDINNDGYDDVIICDEDSSYLYYSSGGQVLNNCITLENSTGFAYGGYVGSAGDIDNDGYDDVISGWYLHFGSEGETMDDIADITFNTIGHVASGDVNNDGYDDVVIGKSLFFGSERENIDNIADVIFSNTDPLPPVPAIGDFNNDSFDDVLIGDESYGDYDKGRADIYFGAEGTSMDAVSDVNFIGVEYTKTLGIRLGKDVAAVGDVNGDNYDDFMILKGGDYYADKPNSFDLYLGSDSSPIDTVIDLSLTFVIGVDEFGWGVDSGFDINDDGYDDLIVSSPWYHRGKTFLYLGGPNIPINVNVEPYHKLPGTGPRNAFLSAGDVNNDGCDDILIIKAYDDDDEDGIESIDLYYGSRFGLYGPHVFFNPGSRSTWIDATGSFAGDVNNDGYDDIIISNGAGTAGLYYGRKSMRETADLIIEDMSAKCSNYVGDVNNDGYDDFALGGYGKVNIYFGGPTESMDNIADVELRGSGTYGLRVVPAGDVNNDGCDDVLVGKVGDDYDGIPGRAYLYFGSPGDAMDATADITFVDYDIDEFSIGLSTAGDVNKDGYDDIMIGATQDYGPGAVRVYFGAEGTSMDNVADIEFVRGNNSFDSFGTDLAIGDLNGDGHNEIIVGDPTYYEAGGVEIYYWPNVVDTSPENDPGYALEFDGVDDYVNCGNNTVLKTDHTITIEAWIYYQGGESFPRIVDKYPAPSIYIDESNSLLGWYGKIGDQVIDHTFDGAEIPKNEWTHIAVTFSGLYIYVYINGERKAYLRTPDFGLLAETSDDLIIGNRDATDRTFLGKIDEVRIWNRERTEAQIRKNMYKTIDEDECGLVGYWQMNNGPGSALATELTGESKGSLINMDVDNCWTSSTIPIGCGSSNYCAWFKDGTEVLGNVSLTTTDGFDEPVELLSTEIENSPNTTSGITGNVLNRYFILSMYTRYDAGTYSANLTFTLKEGEISEEDQVNPGNLKLYKRESRSDGEWTLVATGVSATATTVTFEGITSFSQFTIASETSPLPVEITSFTASLTDSSTVKLKWETATEVNNYGFEIERTTPHPSPYQGGGAEGGGGWETLGFVPGHGNSNSPKSYSFIDNLSLDLSHNLSYRLKQIDFDGNYEYLNTVEVTIGVPLSFDLKQNYPNPFNPTTSIKYQVASIENVKLVLYNTLGQQVATLVNEQKAPGNYEVQFDASHLSSGMYLYKIDIGNKFSSVKKMLLLK
ncbi:MAG: FG-GAP-like repeat-containing protein [Ignavibacteria bacterium]|jgi:hypothetical protein